MTGVQLPGKSGVKGSPEVITRDLPLLTREASFLPASIDPAARTIELVWSTGARRKTIDWESFTLVDEELSLDPKHVDMTRFNAGAPLLNSHRTDDLADVIGSTVKCWLEPGQGRALVRLSKRAAVEEIWQDLVDGILGSGVSIGYQVRRYEITKDKGQLPLYRAVDWEPTEISLVPVGADPGARVRHRSAVSTSPCSLVYLSPRAGLGVTMARKKTAAPKTRASSDEIVAALQEKLVGYGLAEDVAKTAAMDIALWYSSMAEGGEEAPPAEEAAAPPSQEAAADGQIAAAARALTGKTAAPEVLGALERLGDLVKERTEKAKKLEEEKTERMIRDAVADGRLSPAREKWARETIARAGGVDIVRGYIEAAEPVGPGKKLEEAAEVADPNAPVDPKSAINPAMRAYCQKRGYDEKGIQTFAETWVKRYGSRPFVEA